MDVRRVRQAQRVRGVDERLEDRARRHARRADRGVEPGQVRARPASTLDAAGIDDLDRVAAGRAEQPRRVIARAVRARPRRSAGAGTRRCPSGRKTRRRQSACRPAPRATAAR